MVDINSDLSSSYLKKSKGGNKKLNDKDLNNNNMGSKKVNVGKEMDSKPNGKPISFAQIVSKARSGDKSQSVFRRTIQRLSFRKPKHKVPVVEEMGSDNSNEKEEVAEAISPLNSSKFWRSFRKRKTKKVPEPSIESSTAYSLTDETTLTKEQKLLYKRTHDTLSTSFLVSSESATMKDKSELNGKENKVKTSFWKTVFLRKTKSVKNKNKDIVVDTNDTNNIVVDNNDVSTNTVSIQSISTAALAIKKAQMNLKNLPSKSNSPKLPVPEGTHLDLTNDLNDTTAYSDTICETSGALQQNENDKNSALEFVTLSPKAAREHPEPTPEKQIKHSSRHHSRHHHKNHSHKHKRSSKKRERHSKRRTTENDNNNDNNDARDETPDVEEPGKPEVPPRIIPPAVPPRTYLDTENERMSKSNTIQSSTPARDKEKKKKTKTSIFSRSHTEVKSRNGDDMETDVQPPFQPQKTTKNKHGKASLGGGTLVKVELTSVIPIVHVTPTPTRKKPTSPKKPSGFHLNIWKGHPKTKNVATSPMINRRHDKRHARKAVRRGTERNKIKPQLSKAGFLWKRDSHHSDYKTRRYCRLHDGQLRLYKSELEKFANTTEIIDLNHVRCERPENMSDSSSPSRYIFNLKNDDLYKKTFYFAAESDYERKRWMVSITAHIEKFVSPPVTDLNQLTKEYLGHINNDDHMSSISDDAGSKSANSLDISDESEGEIYQAVDDQGAAAAGGLGLGFNAGDGIADDIYQDYDDISPSPHVAGTPKLLVSSGQIFPEAVLQQPLAALDLGADDDDEAYMCAGDFGEISTTAVEVADDDEFYADIGEIKSRNIGFLASEPSSSLNRKHSFQAPSSSGWDNQRFASQQVPDPSEERSTRVSIVIPPAPALPKRTSKSAVPPPNIPPSIHVPASSHIDNISNSDDEFRNDFADVDDIYADIDDYYSTK